MSVKVQEFDIRGGSASFILRVVTVGLLQLLVKVRERVVLLNTVCIPCHMSSTSKVSVDFFNNKPTPQSVSKLNHVL